MEDLTIIRILYNPREGGGEFLVAGGHVWRPLVDRAEVKVGVKMEECCLEAPYHGVGDIEDDIY